MWNPPNMNMGRNMHGAPAAPAQQWQAPLPTLSSGCSSNNKDSSIPPADAVLAVEAVAEDVVIQECPINREHSCSMALTKEAEDSATSINCNIQGIP